MRNIPNLRKLRKRVLDTEWLIQLLSQNKSIHIHDGLGTFVIRTADGWKICGRDDVIAVLVKRRFDDLRVALYTAKSLKTKFLRRKA